MEFYIIGWKYVIFGNVAAHEMKQRNTGHKRKHCTENRKKILWWYEHIERGENQW